MENNQNMIINDRSFQGKENTYLYQLLNETDNGKSVLKEYLDFGFLKKNTKSLLTRLVITGERKRAFQGLVVGGNPGTLDNFNISSTRFQELKTFIEELFNCNGNVYYIPYVKEDRKCIPPSGKLYDHYVYVKSDLIKKGILKKKVQKKTTNIVAYEPCENEEDQLKWLRSHPDPDETVKEYWTSTHPARRAILKSGTSVYDYFSQFAPLSVGIGQELLLNDFDRIHPSVKNTLFNRWPIVKQHLISRLQHYKINNSHDKELLDRLPGSTPENADAVVLHLLPYLIDGDSRKRQSTSSSENNNPNSSDASTKTKEKVLKKFTIEERREVFFCHVETAQDIEPKIEELKEKLHRCGLTLQPMPIFVGPLEKIEAVYVQVLSHRYKVNTTIRGIDLSFKIFTSLDCEYPEQTRSFWTFFSAACFGIDHVTPIRNRSVTSLVDEVLQLNFPPTEN